MREVVITGLGPILPGCDDRATLWRHLREGESQLALEPAPDAPDEVLAIGRVRDFEPARYLREVPERFWAGYPVELRYYLASVYLARDDAALDLEAVSPERVGLFDGAARTTFSFWYDRLRDGAEADCSRRDLMAGLPGQTVGIAASLLGTRGPAYAFAGTCASGLIAIGHAFREVRDGGVDVAFATGHDASLVPPLFAMYRDANLLSLERDDARRAVRPYIDHSTNAFGEGAVTLVLESREHAERRNATILASVEGYRYVNSGSHPTTVDVDGARPAELVTGLLRDAHVAIEDVGFVVGHGNAVHMSDTAEQAAMRRVFGARARDVPLLSVKPIYGHTLGASSAVNVAAAALMLHHGFVVPTANVDPARVPSGVTHQAGGGAPLASDAGVAMSLGMGGHNVGLLLRRAGRMLGGGT